jgi:hypothetical protein
MRIGHPSLAIAYGLPLSYQTRQRPAVWNER